MLGAREYRELVVADEGFSAFLVVDASDRDISFGGTRVDASVTKEMVVELADNMSMKLAGHGSPVGGAKGGVCASPDDPRLKAFLRRFAEQCRDELSNHTILGKDMGARQWMLDEIYDSLHRPQLSVAQARSGGADCPDRLRDLNGYVPHMTGRGVFWSIDQALGAAVRGARVLIQGFGVVGSGVAWHLSRAGARIVGVSDGEKAIVHPEGLDVDVLLAAKGPHGLLSGARLPADWRPSERDDLLTESADLLVLAAGSYLVDGDLAGRLRAPLVVEAANLALTPAAMDVLLANGVRVVPDVVANSSSAALVGHQIASGNQCDPDTLWKEIEGNIRRNTEAVLEASRRLAITSKAAFRRVVQGQEGYAYAD